MKGRRSAAAGATACLAALLVAGCGGGGGGRDEASASAVSTQVSVAMVSFTAPPDGATVGRTVTALVDITGFTIDADSVGLEAVGGRGHLRFSMDDGMFDLPKYSGPNGDLAVKLATQGRYSPSVRPSITYSGLPPGPHTLRVSLANNDGSAQGASDEITFTVR